MRAVPVKGACAPEAQLADAMITGTKSSWPDSEQFPCASTEGFSQKQAPHTLHKPLFWTIDSGQEV